MLSALLKNDLRGQDLRGAALQRCQLQGSDLRDADLGDADLSGSGCIQVDFSGARLDGLRAQAGIAPQVAAAR